MLHPSADLFQRHDAAFVGGSNAPINGGKRRIILFVKDGCRVAKVPFLHLTHTPTLDRIAP
jgi:hypothetical protein